tara:strand:+ start:92 stop:748 length:657 start_codon:yes stop_codon:yes gene_type:complete
MNKEFRKAITNHIDGNYEFIIDCGDLYLRNNVSFEEDLRYCKSIIETYNPTKIKSIKVLINYTIPFEQDIDFFKDKKLENYKNKKDNNFSVLLIEFTQDSNELKLCEEIWFGYEEFNKKIINQMQNLKSIYFFGRDFSDQNGNSPFYTEDDEYIRNTLHNPSWEDSTFLTPSEDIDDFEELKELKKLVGENVELTFQNLNEKCEKLMIKEDIGRIKVL